VPSFLTSFRLTLQYRRQTTYAANGFPVSTFAASSDFKYERKGMFVVKNHVGEPKQTRS